MSILKNDKHKTEEPVDAKYRALDFLAKRIKQSTIYIKNELEQSLQKKTSLNKTAFSMYVSVLINLKDELDYELLKYGSTESEKSMEIYQSLEEIIEECRLLITNDTFNYDETDFQHKVRYIESLSTDELKRYIFNSLVQEK
ncbi:MULTISPECIES: hypothetical protein [Staphylococcus]|uniref:hypothetical protein n=1 Tax=Staphylococcus TaxID=1279 RepID=UPI00044F5884|nr:MULTISPECIES: hypothetical protein [Staphylococcus]MCG2329221.1 hypothetical protein [Staphylococcus epidermidis]AXS25550.1 hypothetical protein D1G35_14330 [Staphylococcus aureus]AXS28290.1 hypothetical protein D1O27_14100 [Staphylococcus aureus]EZU56723.1 hypothetical protein U985_02639 [Staphylococcus aureus 1110803248]KAC49847.1 hypothetical protein W527_02678 [Staphylococcus aureus VET0243R]